MVKELSENTKMFNQIAKKYDQTNRLISFGLDKSWRKKALTETAFPHDGQFLDVACGTGDWTFLTAQLFEAGQVTGLDLSQEMLKVADHKRETQFSALAERTRFLEGDATALPFGDGTFDCVTIGFGLRNIPDYEAALREFWRVLKPGGKLLVLETRKEHPSLVASVHRLYFRHIMPAIGWLMTRNYAAYKFLDQSTANFAYPEELVHLMRAIGYHRIDHQLFGTGTAILYQAEK